MSSITVEEEQRLEKVGLIKFFMESNSPWQNYVENSLVFLARNFPENVTINETPIPKCLWTGSLNDVLY